MKGSEGILEEIDLKLGRGTEEKKRMRRGRDERDGNWEWKERSGRR